MKKEQGITLIALIITIIILLLLAGVVINTLLGTGGIIGNADKSVGQYKNEANKEQEQLNELEKYMNQYQNSTVKEEFEKDPDKYKNPDQSTDNKDIAISEDGESVNLDSWEYLLRTDEDTNESYYELVSKGTLEGDDILSGYPAYHGNYTDDGRIEEKIPAYIYNAETGKVIPVTSLCGTFMRDGYYGGNNLKLKIFPEIPSTITKIGPGTFLGCVELENVVIPDSVESIGDYAFYNCSALTSITITSSVTSIGGHAFSDCTGLTSVTIPSGVKSIGGHAFSDCTGLTSVTIPSGVKSIGWYAFSGCTGLTSVTIPSSVTSIEEKAFYYCTKLEKIYCEAVTKPDGWDSNWNVNNVPVVWGYDPDKTE